MNRHLFELKDRLIQFEGAATYVALAIAARSALRAVPLLEHLPWGQPLPKPKGPLRGPRMSHDEIVLKTLRAAATAWAAARWHSFGKSDHFQAIQHDVKHAGGSSPDAGPVASFAAGAAGWAMYVASETFSRFPESRLGGGRRASCAHFASQTVTLTSLGFLRTFDQQAAMQLQLHMSKDPNWLEKRDLSPSETVVWSAAWEDVRFLERDADVQSLLAQPLWLVPAPDYAQGEWPNFSARLLGRVDENWKFWLDWYETMLADPTQLDESAIVAQVS